MRRTLRPPNVQRVPHSDNAAVEALTGVYADDLDVLLDRISRGSRTAFVSLFDRTCGSVRDTLAARLQDPRAVAAVLATTYVEVWWLSGCRVGRHYDVLVWIDGIVQRRIGEVVISERPRPDRPTPEPSADALPSRYAA